MSVYVNDIPSCANGTGSTDDVKLSFLSVRKIVLIFEMRCHHTKLNGCTQTKIPHTHTNAVTTVHIQNIEYTNGVHPTFVRGIKC